MVQHLLVVLSVQVEPRGLTMSDFMSHNICVFFTFIYIYIYIKREREREREREKKYLFIFVINSLSDPYYKKQFTF